MVVIFFDQPKTFSPQLHAELAQDQLSPLSFTSCVITAMFSAQFCLFLMRIIPQQHSISPLDFLVPCLFIDDS